MRPGPWALTLAVGAYLFFSLIRLGLPGLQCDEVLFDKVTFAWFIAALAGAAAYCHPGWLGRRLGPCRILPLILCRLIGCLPLLVFNIAYPLRGFETQAILPQPESWLKSLPARSPSARWTDASPGTWFSNPPPANWRWPPRADGATGHSENIPFPCRPTHAP